MSVSKAALPQAVDAPKSGELFPPSASRLDDTAPSTFIALRYDKTHVLFRLGEDGDFGLEDPRQEETAFHALPQQLAEYGGAQPFELDPSVFESVKQHYKAAHVGEQWQLEVFAGARVPVVIQKPIEMSWGCSPNSFTAGFIAEVSSEFQTAFIASPQKYFLVHKAPTSAGSDSTAKPAQVGELMDWKPAAEVRSQIEQVVTAKLRQEIAGQYEKEWAREESISNPNVKAEYDAWKQFAENTAAGRGQLTYEMQAFQLSPDGNPRVLVRAQWMVQKGRVFLMSTWLRVGPTVTAEEKDQVGTRTMWAKPGSGGEDDMNVSSLTKVLNLFDRADGYGDALVYTPGYEGYSIVLYHYSAAGLSATNISMADGC